MSTEASSARKHTFKWVMPHVEFSCCRQLPFSKASLCSTNRFQSFDTARVHSLCFFGAEGKKTPKVQHQQTGITRFFFFVLKCLLFICHYKIPSKSINSTLGRNYNTKLYKSFTNKKKKRDKKQRHPRVSVQISSYRQKCFHRRKPFSINYLNSRYLHNEITSTLTINYSFFFFKKKRCTFTKRRNKISIIL